ncbi:L-alanine-DL-glutamate epimerase-like enolase superfamily enzyme [Rhizobium sp. ERR 1071]|uniref:enolase C-terminal domain-like protein n=1 Tax=Rhizobium sp. ERR 1071 TaxID=2572677 RepID=UPI00119C5687|nr:enolase C-terminal domain-like protein [Rhizobium sp. ERR1071]TWB09566.1 L-alanine-DL-glutamate epimerase-like enolase superfamily enzyme [Rhizobium sp. ERR1071]
MKIVAIKDRLIPVSRYADTVSRGTTLTTSVVAIETDVIREGRRVVGYGYASVGRFGQSGLIRERFASRLLEADPDEIIGEDGNLDPFRAWRVMMAGEKLGGHGERCVAIGTLDMAIWDAAAKIAGLPLYRHLAKCLGRDVFSSPRVRVYASGGYLYPSDDLAKLSDEIRRFVDLGYQQAKIKIGQTSLAQDQLRIEIASRQLAGPESLSVDALNAYDAVQSLRAAAMLAPFQLNWFEDACDPLDFRTQSHLAKVYEPAVAAGEALFSLSEAKLLAEHGGLRRGRDVLVFDPVHCYGLPGYLQIVELFTSLGWSSNAFWPHGGHLFALHVTSALGLAGAEVTPFAFHPFNGLFEGAVVAEGHTNLPEIPGIGFELAKLAWRELRSLSDA